MAKFFRKNNLQPNMRYRENCHDNAVPESFFQLLKHDRVKRKINVLREDARADIFDYIEMFYNATRANISPPNLQEARGYK